MVGALCFSMREISADGMGGMHTYPTPTLLMWQEHDDGISRFTGTAFGQNGYPVNTMIKVGATGAACILIHRSVLERIGKEWFNQIPVPDGSLEGEDISFCHRCMDADIPIWVHTGIRTTHMKTVWLSEIDYWTSIVAPPATETVDVIIPALHRPQNVKPLMEITAGDDGTGDGHGGSFSSMTTTRPIEIRRCGGHIIVHDGGTFAQKVNCRPRIPSSHPPHGSCWSAMTSSSVPAGSTTRWMLPSVGRPMWSAPTIS